MLNVYLNFDGSCREAFEFYRSAFGGEFQALATFGDGPGDMQIPEAMKQRIMHVSLPVGASTLMGSDMAPGAGDHRVGNNFSISVSPDGRAEADALFAKISAGGEVIMPLQETFWGAYFGSCRDRFDVNWMFNVELGQG